MPYPRVLCLLCLLWPNSQWTESRLRACHRGYPAAKREHGRLINFETSKIQFSKFTVTDGG